MRALTQTGPVRRPSSSRDPSRPTRSQKLHKRLQIRRTSHTDLRLGELPSRYLRFGQSESTQAMTCDEFPDDFALPPSVLVKDIVTAQGIPPLTTKNIKVTTPPELASLCLPDDWHQTSPPTLSRLLECPVISQSQKRLYFKLFEDGALETEKEWIEFLLQARYYPQHRSWVDWVLHDIQSTFASCNGPLGMSTAHVERVWHEFIQQIGEPGFQLSAMDFPKEEAYFQASLYIGDWYCDHLHLDPKEVLPKLAFLIEQFMKAKVPVPDRWVEQIHEFMTDFTTNPSSYDLTQNDIDFDWIFAHCPVLFEDIIHRQNKMGGPYNLHGQQRISNFIHSVIFKSIALNPDETSPHEFPVDDGSIRLLQVLHQAMQRASDDLTGYRCSPEPGLEFLHDPQTQNRIIRFLENSRRKTPFPHVFIQALKYLAQTDLDFRDRLYTQSMLYPISTDVIETLIETHLNLFDVAQPQAQTSQSSTTTPAAAATPTVRLSDYKFGLVSFCQTQGFLPQKPPPPEYKPIEFGAMVILERISSKRIKAVKEPTFLVQSGVSSPDVPEVSAPQLMHVVNGFNQFMRQGGVRGAVTRQMRQKQGWYFSGFSLAQQNAGNDHFRVSSVDQPLPDIIPFGRSMSPDLQVDPHPYARHAPDSSLIFLQTTSQSRSAFQRFGLPNSNTRVFSPETRFRINPRETRLECRVDRDLNMTFDKSQDHSLRTRINIDNVEELLTAESGRFKPWYDKIKEEALKHLQNKSRQGQDPVLTELDIMIVLERVMEKYFEFQNDPLQDIEYRCFAEDLDRLTANKLVELFNLMEDPNRVPEGKLATGGTFEMALLAKTILSHQPFQISHAEVYFGFRSNFEGSQREAYTGELRCFVVLPARHHLYVFDPAVDDRDRNNFLIRKKWVQEEDSERNKPKPVPKSKLAPLARKVSLALLAGAAALFSYNQLTQDENSLSSFITNVGSQSPFLNSLHGPHAKPDDSMSATHKWKVTTSDRVPSADMLLHDSSVDFAASEMINMESMHDVQDNETQSVVSVELMHPNLIQKYIHSPNVIPVAGVELESSWIASEQTFTVPSPAKAEYLDGYSEPLSKLTQLEVNEKQVTEHLGDLESLRQLPVKERIAHAENVLFDRMIYTKVPDQDPTQVEFAKNWDPDHPQAYWDHIHDPNRHIHGKSPGQCSEMAFTLVQYLRAMDVQAYYGGGFLLELDDDPLTTKTLEYITGDAHRNAIAVVETPYGTHEVVVSQVTTVYDPRSAKQRKQKESKSTGPSVAQQLGGYLFSGAVLGLALSVFSSGLNWSLNRIRRRREDEDQKADRKQKNKITTNQPSDNDHTRKPEKKQTPKKETNELTFCKAPLRLPRNTSTDVLYELCLILDCPVSPKQRDKTSLLLNEIKTAVSRLDLVPRTIRFIHLETYTKYKRRMLLPSRERMKQSDHKRRLDVAHDLAKRLDEAEIRNPQTEEILTSWIEQISDTDYPGHHYEYDLEDETHTLEEKAAELGWTILPPRSNPNTSPQNP